jgi:hypothetical protein
MLSACRQSDGGNVRYPIGDDKADVLAEFERARHKIAFACRNDVVAPADVYDEVLEVLDGLLSNLVEDRASDLECVAWAVSVGNALQQALQRDYGPMFNDQVRAAFDALAGANVLPGYPGRG